MEKKSNNAYTLENIGFRGFNIMNAINFVFVWYARRTLALLGSRIGPGSFI